MTTASDNAPEQIQADIERTRAELGETIDQLVGRLDVKSRAREKAAVTRQRARGQYEQLRARPQVQAGTLAALVTLSAVAALVVWKRRR